MSKPLHQQANELIQLLMTLPMVRNCTLYGSLNTNTEDELSDIDIEIDVSGYDNGRFMLELPELLKDKLPILYSDYAPSLIPDKYIVSLAIDESNPFRIVDICCSAQPHYTTVTKQQAAQQNALYTHIMKLWTANLKHYVRKKEYRSDILRMASKIGISGVENKSDLTLLNETLVWLEENAGNRLNDLVASCREYFEHLT